MSYPRPIQPYNLYANPIWWVGPFKHVRVPERWQDAEMHGQSNQHNDETKQDETAKDTTEWRNGQKDEEILMKI
jgi:hypothetical protein